MCLCSQAHTLQQHSSLCQENTPECKILRRGHGLPACSCTEVCLKVCAWVCSCVNVCVLRWVYVTASVQDVSQLLEWEHGGHDEDELLRVKLYMEIKGRACLFYHA